MESIIKRLDDSNDKHLYNQLYSIRSKYIKNEASIEKFCEPELNSIKKLTNVLRKRLEKVDKNLQDEKIVEVVLSIIGNCTCNNEKASEQAFESSIVEQLINILNNSENPSIVSKTCRLIGNLASFQTIALSLQQKGIALSISNCLQEDANRGVLTMAIRVIRLMWSAKKFRYEILSFGSIYKIMVVLFKLLRNEDDPTTKTSTESDVVILKRKNEPDRTISKEKLSLIIKKMEKHDVEINYEITKPERQRSVEFVMPPEKEKLELISGIMKCLLTLTCASSSQIARSVYADGFGVSCLIFLANDDNKFRSTSLNIISNLSSNRLSQEYLGVNNDLVSNVAELLLNSDKLDKPLEIWEKKFCLNILCLSSENACNRGKMRRSGVFLSLLSTANTSNCDKEIALLVFTFYQFRFDQLGLDALVENGFISVMLKILGDMTKTKELDHIKFNDHSLDEERKEEQKFKQKKRSNVDAQIVFNNFSKFMRYDPGSPSSSSSGYGSAQQFSPSCNSGFSPFNSPSRSYPDNEDSDSDIYSPVCSENEDETSKNDFDILSYIYENDEIGKIEEKAVELDDDASNMTMKEEDIPETDKAKRTENMPELLKQIEEDPVQFVLQLIWKVSLKNSDAVSFVRPQSLLILHKVCSLVQRPNGKVFQILENILLQSRNFMTILKQDFICKIYELSHPNYNHTDCYSCSKMMVVSRELLKAIGSVAESGYGRGEFTNFLITGDEEMRKKIAVNLTYIVSCPLILYDLLFQNKTLEIILDNILNEGKLAAEACDGITIMANNLQIQIASDEDVLSKIIPDDFVENVDLLTITGEGVKFVLEDGETLFEKQTLVKSSEVFNSMFSGNFRESEESEVKFPNYTIAGMKYFYQVLKMEETKTLKQIAPKLKDMNTILQAYELSILYIIPNIQMPLLNVIKIVLDETSVLKVFEWSLRNINQDLLITSVCYFLCGNIDGRAKLKLFLETNQSQFRQEWKRLIIDTILMKLQNSL